MRKVTINKEKSQITFQKNICKIYKFKKGKYAVYTKSFYKLERQRQMPNRKMEKWYEQVIQGEGI